MKPPWGGILNTSSLPEGRAFLLLSGPGVVNVLWRKGQKERWGAFRTSHVRKQGKERRLGMCVTTAERPACSIAHATISTQMRFSITAFRKFNSFQYNTITRQISLLYFIDRGFIVNETHPQSPIVTKHLHHDLNRTPFQQQQHPKPHPKVPFKSTITINWSPQYHTKPRPRKARRRQQKTTITKSTTTNERTPK